LAIIRLVVDHQNALAHIVLPAAFFIMAISRKINPRSGSHFSTRCLPEPAKGSP
jgi:phosphate starvation-inducible membrane PsiE